MTEMNRLGAVLNSLACRMQQPWRILHKDLSLKAYKIQFMQELKSTDFPNRHRFSVRVLKNLEEDPLFSTKIVFNDEAHFWLNGYITKQNFRIWAEEQPEENQELPLHPDKTTVWCGLWAGIGPYFFKNEAGQNVTVNGACYRTMLTELLLPEIKARNLNDIWFQQDGVHVIQPVKRWLYYENNSVNS